MGRSYLENLYIRGFDKILLIHRLTDMLEYMVK